MPGCRKTEKMHCLVVVKSYLKTFVFYHMWLCYECIVVEHFDVTVKSELVIK